MNELAHHGIKNMRWGERRYQYKDGSLTPEGRKRYGRYDGAGNKVGSRAAKKNAKTTAKKAAAAAEKKTKSVSEWSDAELKKKYDRVALENKYYDELVKNKAHKRTKGQKLAKKFMDKVVEPTVVDLSKKGMTAAATYIGKEAAKAAVKQTTKTATKQTTKKK